MHSAPTLPLRKDLCFKSGGQLAAMTILELYRYNYKAFTRQLANTVQSARTFPTNARAGESRQMAITISISSSLAEFAANTGWCLSPIRGGNDTQLVAANIAGLPKPQQQTFGSGRARTLPSRRWSNRLKCQFPRTTRSSRHRCAPWPADLCTACRSDRVGTISPGAEILADGNIHGVCVPACGRVSLA